MLKILHGNQDNFQQDVFKWQSATSIRCHLRYMVFLKMFHQQDN